MKTYTETELNKIVNEAVKKILNEFAVPRKEYIDYAHHISYDIMNHLIKICLFEDIVPHCVPHWRSEIYNFCKSTVLDRLKNNTPKDKAFDTGAIDLPFGEDFEELDSDFFQDVINQYREKESKYRIYTLETAEDAYKRSIERIIKFYSGFREAAINNNLSMLSVALDNFVNNI